MKMKKIYTIFAVCSLLFGLSSCNWLDLEPKDTTTETDLFATGDGYRIALNGIYQQMAGTGMYGQEMTWGFLEVLGQTYYPNRSNTTYYYASQYKYTDNYVKPIIATIWEEAYNNIANCNNIIQRIENASASLFMGGENEKKMIEGEAYALRAFLHFDLLRLFAPSMKNDDGKTYIPYIDYYPVTFQAYTTNQEVLSKVIADLKKAKNLVATFDLSEPKWMLTRYRIENGSSSGDGRDDLFLAYRGYRMNYYAICATLARVYNYAGMYQEAFNEASIVIDAVVDEWGSPAFSFTRRSDVSSGKVKLYDEIVFCLSNRDLWTNYEPYYGDGSNKLELTEGSKDELFDFSSSDVRADSKIITVKDYSLICLKNVEADGSYATYGKDLIPMIRLGEMYYIRAEYYLNLGDKEMAIQELDAVRSEYGCPIGFLSSDDVEEEILKEVHREYLTEGQLFFYYKKFNRYPSKMTSDEQFVLPHPDSEDI